MTPHLAALTLGSKRFLRWWFGEIQSFVHDVIAQLAPTWSRSITIFLEKGRIRIVDTPPVSDEPLLDIDYESTNTELTESVTAQIKALLKGGGRAHLVVCSGRSFIQQLRMPVAALPHLQTAVSLQFPKLLPMRPDELLTAIELVSADSRIGIIDLAALKRAEIEPVFKAVTAAGLRVSSIRLADDLKATPRFRFQFSNATGRDSSLRRVDKLLVGIAAGLGLACTAVTVTQSYRATHALSLAEAHILPAATAALDRRQALLNKLEPLTALTELESRAALAPLLAELTSTLPQDTWITTFEMKDRRLRIVGVTPDSATLVKLMSSSGSLNDVELRSSMSAGVGTGKDRYEITAEIKGGSP